MKRWICPKCGLEVESIGHTVGHECPKNRNRWTRFDQSKEDK